MISEARPSRHKSKPPCLALWVHRCKMLFILGQRRGCQGNVTNQNHVSRPMGYGYTAAKCYSCSVRGAAAKAQIKTTMSRRMDNSLQDAIHTLRRCCQAHYSNSGNT